MERGGGVNCLSLAVSAPVLEHNPSGPPTCRHIFSLERSFSTSFVRELQVSCIIKDKEERQ